MSKELNIVEEKINEKLEELFDSPSSILNEGVPSEEKISLGEAARYTIGDILRLSYIDRTLDGEEATKAKQLLNMLRSLETQKRYIYSAEQRQETQEKIDLINTELTNMGVLFDLSYEGIINSFIKNNTESMTK